MKKVLSVFLALCIMAGGILLAGPADSYSPTDRISVLTPHAPIRIDSNADFDAAHGVSNTATGNGTVWAPWVIENLDINGTGYGNCIYIGNTTERFILRNCNLHHADGGDGSLYMMNASVMLYSVNNATLGNLTLTASQYGLYFYGNSNNNTIDGIIASHNLNSGIIFDNAPKNNTICHSTFHDNGLHGIYIFSGGGNLLVNNTAYLNSEYGFYLYSTNENEVRNCSAHNNTAVGIFLFLNSEHNVVHDNIVRDNTYGIRMYNCYNNAVFHNNLINNANQGYDNTNANMWDDGYPSGGNYWNDYSGTDVMSGPGQNVIGADGIGDTPYVNIGGGALAQDRYPLMVQTTDVPIADTQPPTAISWGPSGNSTDSGTKIFIHWNESMDWGSVEGAFSFTDNFTVWTSANGTWAHDLTFNSTFEPTVPLKYQTKYWVSVNCTATDLAGNALGQNLTWNFTTADEAPYIVSTQPADGQVGVDPHKPFKVVFSEKMNVTAVEDAFSFTDGNRTWDISDGTTNWNWPVDTEFTFLPAETLGLNTSFTDTFDGAGAKDAGGKGLKFGNYSWTFQTWPAPPAPMVINTYPPNGAFGVNVNTYISITFDVEMDASSVELAFSYTDGTYVWTAVNGTIDWFSDNTLLLFQPTQRLKFNSAYTVKIASTAVSIYGIPLDGDRDGVAETYDNFTFGFRTSLEPPTVISHYPTPFQRDLPVDLNAIYINFSTAMKIDSVTSAVSISPLTSFTPQFSGMGKNLTIAITSPLTQGAEYRVTVLGTAVDMAGTKLDGNGDGVGGDRFTFTFLTKAVDVPVRPDVKSFYPNTHKIPIDTYIWVNFTTAMNRQSVEAAFSFTNATAKINGTISWTSTNMSMRFRPSAPLAYNTTYTWTVVNNATNVDGLAMNTTRSWWYVTESEEVDEKASWDWVMYVVIAALVILSVMLYMANRSLRRELKRTRVKLKRVKREAGIVDEPEPKTGEAAPEETVPDEELPDGVPDKSPEDE